MPPKRNAALASKIRAGRTHLSPPEIAARLGVSPDKILAWLRSGELVGVNVATRAGGRPRWRVSLADLADFERHRAAVTAPAPTPRRRGASGDVIEFF